MKRFGSLSDDEKVLNDKIFDLSKSVLIKTCNCRKPKSGMIDSIAEKYNIDLSNSFMVGDSYTDVTCGKNAGVKTVFIGDFKCDSCNRLCNDKPDFICKNILEVLDVV